MTLADHLRIQARANRLANHRLHAAMTALSEAEFVAPRTGFFPSLAGTLNHVLAVDLYYVAALHADADTATVFHDFAPCATLASLAQRQAASDLRLIGFCDALGADGADAWVDMPRRDGVQRDRAGHVLAHLFMHQTHHRGQAHAMLSATAVAPPQLDEFLLPSDAPLRARDMAALGWDEAAVYGGA
jgi:uncharacterized damage-inducible protein DinB